MTGNYFAALPVTVPDGFLDHLRTDAPEALRWFHPEDLHLTLAFFGREETERLGDVLAVLERVGFAGLDATLGRLVALPRPRRFSALSFDLEKGRDAVVQLISRWREPLCQAAGIAPESRPPRPHLTIARPDRRHPAFRPGAILKWIRHLPVHHTGVRVHPPALYGWSPDRPARQFRRISSSRL